MKTSEFMEYLNEFETSYTKIIPQAINSLNTLKQITIQIGSEIELSGELLRPMLEHPPEAVAAKIPIAEAEWHSANNNANLTIQTIMIHINTTKIVFNLLKYQLNMALDLSREPDSQDWSLTIATLGTITTIIGTITTTLPIIVAGYITGLAGLLEAIQTQSKKEETRESWKLQAQSDELARKFFNYAKDGINLLAQLSKKGDELAERSLKQQKQDGIFAWREKWRGTI